MVALWDLRGSLSRLAAQPSLRCLMVGAGQVGEAEWVAEQLCQKADDRLFLVHRWPTPKHESDFCRRMAQFGEKVSVRTPASVVSWLADPVPYQRFLRNGCQFVYVDARAMSAVEIACRSVQAWERLAPGGVFVWRDYLHPRRADIQKAVNQVLADRPHRVAFQNSYLGVCRDLEAERSLGGERSLEHET